MKPLIALLIIPFLITASQAGHQPTDTECDTYGVSRASLTESAEMYGWDDPIFEEPSPLVDRKATMLICFAAGRTRFDSMMRVIDRNEWTLHEIYPHIDCRRVNKQGPTLLHMIVQESSRLVFTGVKIAEKLQEAKQANPKIDLGTSLNITVPFASSCRTVLGILDWNLTVAAPDPDSVLWPSYRELRRLLVELGAE